MQIAGGGSDREDCGGKALAKDKSEPSNNIGFSMAVRSGGSKVQDASSDTECGSKTLRLTRPHCAGSKTLLQASQTIHPVTSDL